MITPIKQLVANKELVFQLARRDIVSRYRQSILGYVWAILPGVVAVIIFTFLTSKRVLPIGDPPIPYPLFVIWNITIWQFFSSIVLTSTTCVTDSDSLCSKVNFAKESLVFASLGQPLFDFLVRLTSVFAIFLIFTYSPPLSAIFIPLTILPVILLAIGLGFIFALMNIVLRDIHSAVGVILTLGIFAAPILYPAPTQMPYALINVLNPISPILIASHDLLSTGTISSPLSFIVACTFSTVIFLVGWRLFTKSIGRTIERM